MRISGFVLTLAVAYLSPCYAQEIKSASTEVVDTTFVVAGKWKKVAPGAVEIPFNRRFSEPPIVVITPNWSAGVAYIETITKVENDRFQVTSNNAADNYFVTWIAIGKP